MTLRQVIQILNGPQVLGQLRHMLNTVGALLAYRGLIVDVEWQIYTGLGLAVLAFVGSLLAREKRPTTERNQK